MATTRMLYFPRPQGPRLLPPASQEPTVVQQQGASAVPSGSLDLVRQAFDLSPDPICLLGFDGRIRRVNRALENALGFAESELAGKSLISFVHPEDREPTLAHEHDLLVGVGTPPLENRVRRKDGSYLWFLWNQALICEQQMIFASARDITERKSEEGELRVQRLKLEMQANESAVALKRAASILLAEISHRRQVVQSLCEVQEKYRSVFENAVEGIFQSTPEGTYLSVNPALARIKGYNSPEELIADMRNIGEQSYVDPVRRLELKELMEKRGVAMGFEYQAYRKDGRKVWLSLNARAVKAADGTLRYYEGSIEDITERKRLAEQLQLAQKMEAVGQLAGGIAHDFNNLLGVIGAHTELAVSRLNQDSPQAWNMEQIAKAARRAARLVRQLLAFSQRQVLEPTVLDLNSVLRDVESMLTRIIGEHILLTTVLDNDLGCIKADPTQMEQVIINLALNARDAMPKGGKLTIETCNATTGDRALKTMGAPDGNYIAITVSDTGTGMDSETQARIFEPFFTTKEQGKGTGLGLATVYGIVKQSGGFISVSSKVGQGTTFQILLPRASGRAIVAEEETEPSETESAATETILLVEDDNALRQVILTMLMRLGYKALEARNGETALRIAKKFGGKIDLLLTDVVMPGLSGPDLVAQVATLNPEMKILLMSGYPQPSVANGEVLRRDKPMLKKPFKQQDLARIIRKVLEVDLDSKKVAK